MFLARETIRQSWDKKGARAGVLDLTVAVKIALDAHTWISTQKAEGNGSSSGTDDGKATNRPAASPQAFNVSLEGNPHPLRGLHKFRYLQFRRCDVRSRRVHNTE